MSLTDVLLGQWWCTLSFIFYNSSSGICMPPSSFCANTPFIDSTIHYQGVFPAVSTVALNFTLAVTGGTGRYSGAKGYITGEQAPDYSHFTYYTYT